MLIKKLSARWEKWGENKRAMPPHATTIKERILRATPAPDEVKRRRWYLRPWQLSLVAVTVFLFAVFVPQLFRATREKSVVFNAGGGGQIGQYLTTDDLGLEYGVDTGLASANKSVVDKIADYLSDNTTRDTREFMRTDYSAFVKTRETEKFGQETQLLVRGLGGRVDRAELGDKHARIVFVIPKDSLDLFRAEIGEMALADRFLEESVNNVNLLPKKQTVEENINVANEYLTAAIADRQTLVDKHNRTIIDLQTRVDYLGNKIYELSRVITTSTSYQQSLDKQIAQYATERDAARQEIIQENTRYKKNLATIDGMIKNLDGQLADLSEQDESILDTVATVSGVVNFEWVSVWDIIDMYVPLRVAIPTAVVLLIVFGLFFRREKGFELPD